jgi:uncharacterized protein YijF (DUF1287 family)
MIAKAREPAPAVIIPEKAITPPPQELALAPPTLPAQPPTPPSEAVTAPQPVPMLEAAPAPAEPPAALVTPPETTAPLPPSEPQVALLPTQPMPALPEAKPEVLPVPTPPAAALPSPPETPAAIEPAPPAAVAVPEPLTPAPAPALPPAAIEIPAEPKICLAPTPPATAVVPATPARADFGRALAAAAKSQLGELVVYTDAYRRLSYPMGDVPKQFGVCTDVVVRAYRALGVDLQALVHTSRASRGDASIDHRRTEVLRRFFTAQGLSLPPSTYSEDYQPGDIVTYYRPQNTGSSSHIAIVSDEIGPSGQPMIIHNRGWGPQLEDALFVDQITGHYRYSGPASDAPVVTASTAVTPAKPKLTRVALKANFQGSRPAALRAKAKARAQSEAPVIRTPGTL